MVLEVLYHLLESYSTMNDKELWGLRRQRRQSGVDYTTVWGGLFLELRSIYRLDSFRRVYKH